MDSTNMCRLVGQISILLCGFSKYVQTFRSDILIVIWIQQICEDLLVRYYYCYMDSANMCRLLGQILLLLYGFSKYVQTCRSDILIVIWIQGICADLLVRYSYCYMDSANMWRLVGQISLLLYGFSKHVQTWRSDILIVLWI